MMETPAKPRVVKCPTCGSGVEWGPQSPYRPFCSDRCRLIDLGAWATDQYRVAGEAPLDNESDPLASGPH